MNKYFKYFFIIVLLNVTLGLDCALAKELVSAIKPQTHVLQRIDLPQTNYQAGMGIAEFAPNTIKPRQVQTGPELLYVLKGEIIYMSKGHPPRTIKAGESYQIPAGEVHLSKAGPEGAKVLATWVLEKRKLFAIPVP